MQVTRLLSSGSNSDSLLSYYRKNIELNGTLYFHRISDYRMRGASSRCSKIVVEMITARMLSYSESLPRCGIGRGWPRTRAGSTGCLLGANDQPGSTTHRFEGTTESAWKIIDSLSICWPAQHRPLALQREMVDKHLPLQRTTAGKTVLDRYNFTSGSKGIFELLKWALRKRFLQCRRLWVLSGSGSTHFTGCRWHGRTCLDPSPQGCDRSIR